MGARAADLASKFLRSSGPARLRERVRSWQDCFDLLSAAELGRTTLASFLPALESGRVQIVECSVDRLQAIHGGSIALGSPAGGFVQVSAHESEILIDSRLPLGLVAPLLFHEMVHATDLAYIASFSENQRLWSEFHGRVACAVEQAAARKRKPSEEVKDSDIPPRILEELWTLKLACERFDHRRIFQAERRAYDHLYLLVKQLRVEVPGFIELLYQPECARYALDQRISDATIARAYRLNGQYL